MLVVVFLPKRTEVEYTYPTPHRIYMTSLFPHRPTPSKSISFFPSYPLRVVTKRQLSEVYRITSPARTTILVFPSLQPKPLFSLFIAVTYFRRLYRPFLFPRKISTSHKRLPTPAHRETLFFSAAPHPPGVPSVFSPTFPSLILNTGRPLPGLAFGQRDLPGPSIASFLSIFATIDPVLFRMLLPPTFGSVPLLTTTFYFPPPCWDLLPILPYPSRTGRTYVYLPPHADPPW